MFPMIKETATLENLAKLYVDEVVRFHAILLSIVPNSDPRFTSKFWQALQEELGVNILMSSEGCIDWIHFKYN